MVSIAQALNSYDTSKQITMVYKNWKGEISTRHIIPFGLWWGSTPYHTTPQWLLRAFDVDKKDDRDFALMDILEYVK